MNNTLIDEPIVLERAFNIEETLYYKIAAPMLRKGYTVWPVKPEPEKTGVFGWNTQAHYADEIVHRCLARKFPNHNAGVISKRGVGNLMFIDIDSSGVLERMEGETGQKISGTTFSVCSRPESAPHKRHLYYRQTVYSVMKWKSEINVRDVTQWTPDRNGNLIHPTLFDVKGIGGGGYVVAPGSVRAKNEVYTVIDDVPVIDVPDFLVDWLAKEVTKWKSDKHKEQQVHAAKFATLSKSEKTALQEAGDASGFPYPASEIYPFMNWRAAILASNAVSKKNIERQLVEELNRDFAGGKEFIQSEDGRTKIRGIVASKRLGTVKWGWVGPKRKATLVDGLKITARQTRHSLLVAAMQEFPHSVTAEAGYDRLQEALVGTAFQLVKGRGAAEKAVSQVRKTVGYAAQRTASGWIWVRPADHHLTTTHIQVK